MLAVFVLTSISFQFARSFRTSKIPNGGVYSCATCHVSAAGSGPRNSFGKEVEKHVTPDGHESFWGPELAKLDSDGDGYTNGEELQDPDGVWLPGMKAPGDQSKVSDPGDPDSTPNSKSSAFPYITNYKYNLSDNFPNPVATKTKIPFILALPSKVHINIYDLEGNQVASLVNKFMNDGEHDAIWDVDLNNEKAVKTGIYFYSIQAGKYFSVKKMVVIK